MEGRTVDRITSVNCTVSVDPDQAYVDQGSFGLMLVFRGCRVKAELSFTGQDTPYRNGQARLLNAAGWIGFSGSPRGAAIPMQTVSAYGDHLDVALPLRDEDIEADSWCGHIHQTALKGTWHATIVVLSDS